MLRMSSSSGISANSRVRTRRARRASTSATARLAAGSRDPYRPVGGAVLYFAIGSLAGQFIGKLAGQPLGIRATAMRLSRDMSVKSILRAIALGSCLLVLTTQVVTAASANSWSVGPSMNAARYGHSATVLLDGRVLVAGGGSNPDAEIYNPASGTWSPTGPMTVARADHAAVRLADGRVLVISGNYYAASSARYMTLPRTRGTRRAVSISPATTHRPCCSRMDVYSPPAVRIPRPVMRSTAPNCTTPQPAPGP